MFESLDEIRTFVCVVEAGSLSAASRSLRVSVNAVWRRVERIEERAGAPLIERTTRSLRPTEAGARLLLRARAILAEMAEAERELTSPAGRLRGTVRVALSPELARDPLVADLGRLLADHAELRMEIVGRAVQAEPVAAQVDIVVWAGPVTTQSATRRRVGALQWALAATPAYVARRGAPSTPAELRAHECLLALRAAPERSWTLLDDAGEAHEVAVRGRFESDSSAFLRAALERGVGIGQVLRREVIEGVAAGRLVHILPAYRLPPLDISLVTPEGRLRLASVRAVADAITRDVQRLAQDPSPRR